MKKATATRSPRRQVPAARKTASTAGRQFGWGLAIVVIALAAYWPSFTNGYIWDDGQHVLHNPVLRSTQGLVDIWTSPRSIPQYYPLVHTTFWLEFRAFGTQPGGYHVVNALLHALSALLLWRVLMTLQVPGAWLAATLFAVHPVHVETVAWITERKNVLSLLMALAAMLAYFRFDPPVAAEDSSTRPPDAWRYYALALVLFVFSLLSKTVTASMPAVLLVIYWWKRNQVLRQVPPLLPFFAVGVALALVTVRLEQTHVGAQGEEWSLTTIERLLVAGRATWFYAAKLIWPYPLMFFYPRWQVDQSIAWQYLFPLAAVVLLAAAWMLRGKWGRGPLSALLIFGGVLVPALGFFDVYPFRYSYVADHFQYHASIALIALLASVGTLACQPPQRRNLGLVLASMAVLACGLLTFQRTHVFRNVRTLYEDVIAKNPASWPAYGNLGDYWRGQGQFDVALAHFREALHLAPPAARWQMHANIGDVLLDLGRPEQAIEEYQRGFEHCPTNHRWALHLHLANALAILGRHADAVENYQHVLQHQPEAMIPAHRAELAACWQALGYDDRAIAEVEQAVAASPDAAAIQLAYGRCLAKAGRHDQALTTLRRAYQLEPRAAATRIELARLRLQAGQLQQAANELADLLDPRLPADVRAEALAVGAAVQHAAGNRAKAREQFKQALQLAPAAADIRREYGRTLHQQGDAHAAIGSLQQAAQLQPLDAATQHLLGRALAETEQVSEAVPHFEQALQLKPGDMAYRFDLAQAQLTAGQPAAAEASLREILAATNTQRVAVADVHNLLGMALHAQQRPDDAAAAFRAALQADPKHPAAAENLRSLEAASAAKPQSAAPN